MNRYSSKSDVILGDIITFDNTTSFVRDLQRIKYIGKITNLDLEDDLVEVSFKINAIKDPVIRNVPYFLCQ
jgi:hypothetical protein